MCPAALPAQIVPSGCGPRKVPVLLGVMAMDPPTDAA